MPHAKKQPKPYAEAVHNQKCPQAAAASNDIGRQVFVTYVNFGFDFFSCGKLAVGALVTAWLLL